MYLQEARVRPDREVKLGRICNEQHVAVNMYGGSDRPEEEGEDVTGLVWGNNDGCAEVLHLKQNQKKCYGFSDCECHVTIIPSAILNLKHGCSFFRQRHVMYLDGKTEGICKENGSVHGVNRTVPNVKQCSCVVKAQVAEKKGEKKNQRN